ncbi:Vacuolar protein-sorting-associated protein 27 [Coemansia javaensis]|uniref:Vacuolar protein sorting-associated protein 27 n=1 Tax=Coemansia javaensis TaxID=2761396 RepID=A0A9W8H9E5_9FUNG|nr:Vacuolar protein-sorting-associated protein 27 [Coemansia javaensis]
MVMRFFYGSPIEDDIGRLTSEDVPGHELDMAKALNFADKVRSKEYGPKDVAHALRARLDHPNPNTQILVLSLADICVKNGGTLIQLELSRREFIDAIAGLLDSKTGRDYELRELVLRLIQEWAALFRNHSEMGYVAGVLERMKRTGHTFPAFTAPTSSAIIDAASAPEWTDSPVCQRCRTAFTMTNRKHHCRNCGLCFCNDCSSNSTPIPKFAIYDPVRVCHGCYLRLKKIVPDQDDAPGAPTRSSSRRAPAAASPAPNIPDDDEDLKRAIELSLQEAQKRPNYADYTLQGKQTTTSASAAAPPAPRSASVQSPARTAMPPASAASAHASATQYPTVSSEPYPVVSSGNNDEDEDDPDLRAAIEASLRDMPNAGGVPDYLPAVDASRQPPANEAEDDAPLSAFMPAAAIDDEVDDGPLSAPERENIQLFEALLTRLRDSGQDIRFDPQIQYLHESIQQLHPRITGAIDSVDQKHKEFVKLHDRIVTAIKIYDQLLDKRLRSSTYMGVSSATPTHPHAQQSLYPAAPAPQAAFGAPAPPLQPQPQLQAMSSPGAALYQHDYAPEAVPLEHRMPPGLQPAYGDAQAVQARSIYEQPSPAPQPAPTPMAAAFGPAQAHQPPALGQPLDMAASAPPPIPHIPSIPALQPTAKTPLGQQPPAPTPPAPSEPEEALLIEL